MSRPRYRGNRAQAEAFSERTGIPAFPWKVGDSEACNAGVAKVEAALGPVDVLVNNAGITRGTMPHKMRSAQWREVLDVNLGGCFNLCRAAIDGMRERRFSCIVNMSSVNGQSGQAGQTNHAATKAGLLGFTKSLAPEGASRNGPASSAVSRCRPMEASTWRRPGSAEPDKSRASC